MLSAERGRECELARSRSIPTQRLLPEVEIPRFAQNDKSAALTHHRDHSQLK